MTCYIQGIALNLSYQVNEVQLQFSSKFILSTLFYSIYFIEELWVSYLNLVILNFDELKLLNQIKLFTVQGLKALWCHTHVHTHTHAYTYTHVHEHMHACTHTRTNTHTCVLEH